MRMENVVKQTELLEKTGVYDEDLKRRFSLTLKYSGLKGKKILVIGMNPDLTVYKYLTIPQTTYLII